MIVWLRYKTYGSVPEKVEKALAANLTSIYYVRERRRSRIDAKIRVDSQLELSELIGNLVESCGSYVEVRRVRRCFEDFKRRKRT